MPKGKIVSFYSYKGGTGRSMALANIAWILASNKKKVLVIDWDLEAPGLHRYFFPFLRDSELTSTDGLIDFLIEYVNASLTNDKNAIAASNDWFIPYTDLERYTVSLQANFIGGGTLDFVPAGRQDSNYSFRVNSFDWMVFYEKLNGGAFLNMVRDQIKEEYDYILIDSRTGVSDTSGICTIQMPDSIVACFTYNIQSIDGVSAVLGSIFKQRQENRISIFPVPTRVELGEKDRLDRARVYAKDKLNLFLRVVEKDNYWDQVEILYQPYYAYEEILATFGDKAGQQNSILASMERIANFVTNKEANGWIPPTEDERSAAIEIYLGKYRKESSHTPQSIQSVQQLETLFGYPTKGHCFISYSTVDGLEFAMRLADELESGYPYINVWIDKRDLKPNEDWDDQLAEAIKTCKVMLFIMTNDSVAEGSICKDEWTRALKYKKPVIPLRVSNGIEIPFRLANRQWIDFTKNFDDGLARLRKNISWLVDSPEGYLQNLKDRLADAKRDLRRANDADKHRIQAEIDELNNQIERQQEVVANPQAAQQATQKSIEAGLERELESERPVPAKTESSFINPPPGIAPTYFQDREIETREIVRFLTDASLRMMTIVGRGGIGKTALVCRLLKSLEGGVLPDELGRMEVEGIVYLSESGSHRISFANIFYDLSKLLSNEIARELDALYKNPQASTRSKMQALLEKFGSAGQVVLLLDNFETFVDTESFTIRDMEVDEALRAFLDGSHTTVKILITTRVAPRTLNLFEPGRQRVLSLDEGLESPYAENILREMDSDGRMGLRSASDQLLSRARERTRGFPRALEALFAILASDRYTTLEELLAMPMPDNVVETLVGEAFNRLDPIAQKVMQALAVYNRPVRPAAIDYLLQPHLHSIDSPVVLNRLVNMFFARREAGKYYLHPADRQYALSTVAEDGRELDFSRHNLTLRAADYFAKTRKPRAEWKKLDDVAAQLAEFDLRFAAGDFDTAAKVLTEIDFDYLFLWGHYWLLIEMHERLQGKINEPTLSRMSTGNLGLALQFTGQVHKSIEYFQRAVASARKNDDRQAQGIWLSRLGDAYADLGDLSKAIEFYEQALVITDEIGDRRGEGAALGGLGNAYADLGDARKAIEFYEQQLVIVREFGDRRGEGNALGNLGLAYAALGDARKAIEFFEQALVIAREIGDRRGEGNALGSLGIAYAALGDARKAIEFYEQALVIAREIGDRRGEGNALGGLGSAYADLGEARKAIEFHEQNLEIAREIGDRRGEGNVLGNLGAAYANLGDARKAIEFHEQAMVISREIGDRRGEGTDLSNIAGQYSDLGEYEKSIDYYEQALQNAREIDNKFGESKRLNGLASVFIETGDLQRAIDHSQESLRIGQEMSSPEACIESSHTLATALLFAENLAEALQCIQEAGKYNREDFNFSISTLHGIITLRQGDASPARQAFVRAIAQADEILAKTPEYYSALDAKGLALCGLAICDDKKYVADAIETFRAARRIAPHAGIVKRVLRLFDELVKCDKHGVLKEVRKAAEGSEQG